MMGRMGSVLRFAAAAKAVGVEARRLGLEVPAFRSPPRLPGVDRSLCRRRDAPPAIAVRLAARPFEAVAADMVEGVVVANSLRGPRATEVRRQLLDVVLGAPAPRRVA
jgi:hypothetical protein